MMPFQLQRLGIVIEAEPGNPHGIEGVLNPGAVRGPDGQLYLFPRFVAHGNFSRIGIARVQFNDDGDPVGVQRLGVALEPQTEYELHPSGGGCEDPRVTFVEQLQRYVMTYTAFGCKGPRIALAASNDLFQPRTVDVSRESMWISYAPSDAADYNRRRLATFARIIDSLFGSNRGSV